MESTASRSSTFPASVLGVLACLLVAACGGSSGDGPSGGGGSGGGSGGGGSGAPVISSFTASDTRISAAQAVTLSWSVSRATSLSIDHGVGTVTGTSTTVQVSGTTTFTLTANGSGGTATATATVTFLPTGTVRIAYLHHSTGMNIWNGGVDDTIAAYNTANGTHYQITERQYPTSGGNNPYDYWNLWVNGGGTALDTLAANYDVIVFKHCYPVSDLGTDTGHPDVTSDDQTAENYKLQYAALKTRMNGLTGKKFIIWTGAARVAGETNEANARRARDFFAWVRDTWDVEGDNVFVWDFWTLETGGQDALYLLPENSAGDSHPGTAFSQEAAPLIAQRIIDVIEGNGDTYYITGRH